jgi:hypothetical protein
MAAIGTALMGKILGHSEAEKAFRSNKFKKLMCHPIDIRPAEYFCR